MKQPIWILGILVLTGIMVNACGSGTVSLENESSTSPGQILDNRVLADENISLANNWSSAQTFGISVYGIGKIPVIPDLAIISVGVESRKPLVKEAMLEASKSMNRMIDILRKSGIEENDIMTENFNISPQYSWVDHVGSDGFRYNEQILTGYVVSNEASVRTRELNSLGALIDDLVVAGGKPVRVKGIKFSVMDSKHSQKMARELAMEDAREKANQYALAGNVLLGSPIYIGEANSSPVLPNVGRAEFGMATVESTPILTGELEMSSQLHVIFEIR